MEHRERGVASKRKRDVASSSYKMETTERSSQVIYMHTAHTTCEKSIDEVGFPEDIYGQIWNGKYTA